MQPLSGAGEDDVEEVGYGYSEDAASADYELGRSIDAGESSGRTVS